ncbi:MAG: Eco57I restriction-modification methylase domain-containing protein [Bacteroidales bacterium]|nr:Eco57I restriction-modification methylase domain-containing protein [Bacteroidales bacterium]
MIKTKSKIKKNKYGQYFTPKLIADFMIELADIDVNSKILEPSSGKGVFLDLLLEKGFNNITAYEIDKDISNKYKFVRNESFVSAKIQDKYKLIIGNPPYIRWKNLEHELKNELAINHFWNKYFNSLCDYSYLFILKSIELLEENGQLIFITPEYWLNTMHSLSLRNYMVRNGFFSEIYHFNETPIFEKATVSTIVFKYIKTKSRNNEKIDVVKYYANKKLTKHIVEDIKNKKQTDNTKIIQTLQFKENKRWLLTDDKTIRELQIFENKCKKQNPKIELTLFKNNASDFQNIGEFCEIGNGMVSGLDKAFQFNGHEFNENEKKCRIKVIKAKDIKPFFYTEITNYIFANEILDEATFKTDFPNFYQKLQAFKSQLEKRYQYNRKINFWEWVFLRNYNLFNSEKPRIFVPCKERISNKNYFRFAYVDSGFFPTQDVTAIFKKDTTKESLFYILALLNNYRTFNWLKHNGVVKGNIVEFSEKPIASIPFRAIDWQNQEDVDLHDKITDLCKKIVTNKKDILLKKLNQYIDNLF